MSNLENGKKKESKIYFQTSPSKTNLYTLFYLILFYPLIFAIGFLVIYATNFNLLYAILVLFPIIMSIVIYSYYLLSQPVQLKLGEKGLILKTGLGEKIYNYSELENFSPMIKIDHTEPTFPRYYGLILNKKGEKDIFVTTNSKEAKLAYLKYLKQVPEALNEDYKRIPIELEKLKNYAVKCGQIKDFIAFFLIFISVLISMLALPDINLRGEYLSPPVKFMIGLLIGLILVGGEMIFYGMLFGQNLNAYVSTIKWRKKIYNSIRKKRSLLLLELKHESIDAIRNITVPSMKYTGLLIIIMSLIMPIIASYSIASNGYSFGKFAAIFLSPLFVGGGFILYNRAKRIERGMEEIP